jgi:hypothetical protein
MVPGSEGEDPRGPPRLLGLQTRRPPDATEARRRNTRRMGSPQRLFPRPGDKRGRAIDDGTPHRASLLGDTVEARAIDVIESTIPADMTIREWRAWRSSAATPARRRSSRALAAVRRLCSRREGRCDHLHGTTTRYDRAAKRLDFLLVCPFCKTEKVIHSLAYEPRFEPTGTVHTLRPGDPGQAPRRAA